MMGFNQLYRFAAVEVAGADFKAKAVSLVMVGGIVSGTLGLFIAAQGKTDRSCSFCRGISCDCGVYGGGHHPHFHGPSAPQPG